MAKISKRLWQEKIEIHEAGHAVAAYLFGLPFVHVSAESDGQSAGRLGYISSGLSLAKISAATNPALLMRRSGMKYAIVGLSGWAAEQAFFHGFDGGSSDDFKKVARSIKNEFELSEVLSRANYLFSHREVLDAVKRLANELRSGDVSRKGVGRIVTDALDRKSSKRIVSRVLAGGDLAIRRPGRN